MTINTTYAFMALIMLGMLLACGANRPQQELAGGSLLQVRKMPVKELVWTENPTETEAMAYWLGRPLLSKPPPTFTSRVRVLKMVVVNRLGMSYLKAGFDKWILDEAFTANLFIFSMDDDGLRECQSLLAQRENCLRTGFTFGDSGFKQNDFFKINWLKWYLMRYSLTFPSVESIFYFDADTAILKPFDEYINWANFDFRYQSEDAPDRYLNSGQLWFNRTNASFRYIAKILQHDGKTDRLEQDYAFMELEKSVELRAAPLPIDRFHSQCYRNRGTVVTSRMATYHVACTIGDEKFDRLRNARNEFNFAVQGGGPISHIIPDNGMCCLQGLAEYLEEKLENMKASVLNAHRHSIVAIGTCASTDYKQTSTARMCFPNATLHTSLSHPIKNVSEPTVIAACTLEALKHGIAAVHKGTAELCRS